jgi:hypothetical protein
VCVFLDDFTCCVAARGVWADLRGSNPADPADVVAARKQEADVIRQWLQQAHLEAQGEMVTETDHAATATSRL